jgi:hypothetical protein
LCPQSQPDLFLEEQWRAMYRFFDSSYFKRFWIIQEIALATGQVVALVDGHCLPFEGVTNGAYVMTKGYHVILPHIQRATTSIGVKANDDTWNTISKIERLQRKLRTYKQEWYRNPDLLLEIAKDARCKDNSDQGNGILWLIDKPSSKHTS